MLLETPNSKSYCLISELNLDKDFLLSKLLDMLDAS